MTLPKNPNPNGTSETPGHNPAQDASYGAAPTRREFLQTSGAAAAGALALGWNVPAVHAGDKSGRAPVVLGDGAYKYEAHHGWGQLPDNIRWGETHGVTVDPEGFIYIKHRAIHAEPVMDAIVVFDPAGKYVRSFGKEFHGGGHGIDLRIEDKTPYLYLSDVKRGLVVKTDLKGTEVWKKAAPPECTAYDKPGAKFVPTNVAFSPDGGFYIADGYGSHYVHQYDAQAKYVRTWGGFGAEVGKFKTPHGIWLDNRPQRAPNAAGVTASANAANAAEPLVVIADRANARLQYFHLDGKPAGILNNVVSFPAHFDIRDDVLLVPDLHARVTLLDKSNAVIAHLGYDADWTKAVLDGFKMRSQPNTWKDGRFIHPHDACFDKDGNIFVVEWVAVGRVTFLRRVS